MKTILLCIITFLSIAQASQPQSHAMLIKTSNATEVPTESELSGVDVSHPKDLVIIQKGWSCAHDHKATIDMSNLKTDQSIYNAARISLNETDIVTGKAAIIDNETRIGVNEGDITALQSNQVGRDQQITSGSVSGHNLTIDQENGTGLNQTEIDMSNLITNQGNTNAGNIVSNKTNIAANKNDISTLRARPDQITHQQLNGNGELVTSETSADGSQSKVTSTDLTGLKTIQSNTNAADVAKLKKPREQITSMTLDGTVLVTTQQKPGDDLYYPIDKSAEVRTSTQPRIINSNKNIQRVDLAGLKTNQGSVNRTHIDNNSKYITINRTDINANKKNIQNNYESITINSSDIKHNLEINNRQQTEIDSLKNKRVMIENQMMLLNDNMAEASQYTVDTSAGSMAVATIDFGTVKEDHWEIGAGFGVSSGLGDISNGFAGAIGVKYGITDDTAAIAKGWSAGDNYAAGVGFTYAF